MFLKNAQQALRLAAWPPTPENLDAAYKGLLTGLHHLAEKGIATVSDAGGYWPRGHHEAWLRAEKEGALTVCACNALYVSPDLPFEKQIQDLKRIYSNDPDRRVRFNQAKIYADGILSQGTGALYEPYDEFFDLPDPPERGFLYFKPKMLNRYAYALEKIGFQLHFHATGDRGAGLALDAIEHALKQSGIRDRRHRITHLYLIDRKDRPRFKTLGVVADFQLSPDSIDPDYADYMEEYIGDRAHELLPVASMLDSGAKVILSSDWDADVLEPFEKIETVVTRATNGIPGIATAIKMMTLDAAYLLHHEDKTGSIEEGKLADLIILDQDLFTIPTNQIKNTKVLMTLLSGEEVYRAPGF
ncbi:MAG: amidohydrolase family protein [Kiritimatiellae bacterium]|nr:amidohydrolase family protein [Kiritimatiellia bacterium]